MLEMRQCQVVQFNEVGPQREMAELEGGRTLGAILEDLVKGPVLVKCSRVDPVAQNLDRGDVGTPSNQFGDVVKYFIVITFTYTANGNLLYARQLVEGNWDLAVGVVEKKDTKIGKCFQSVQHSFLCPITILFERLPSNEIN